MYVYRVEPSGIHRSWLRESNRRISTSAPVAASHAAADARCALLHRVVSHAYANGSLFVGCFVEICLEPYPRRRIGILGPGRVLVLFVEFSSFSSSSVNSYRAGVATQRQMITLSSGDDDFFFINFLRFQLLSFVRRGKVERRRARNLRTLRQQQSRNDGT